MTSQICLLRSMLLVCFLPICFFFNAMATTEIYTLSLHDALPIFDDEVVAMRRGSFYKPRMRVLRVEQLPVELLRTQSANRSEEHTSELQSHSDLVCRLLLEKKKREWLTVNYGPPR